MLLAAFFKSVLQNAASPTPEPHSPSGSNEDAATNQAVPLNRLLYTNINRESPQFRQVETLHAGKDHEDVHQRQSWQQRKP